MKNLIPISIWIILSIFFSSVISATPINDNLDSAINITTFPYTNQQSSQQSNDESTELLSKCFEDFTTKIVSASVWYKYTATKDQTIAINTFGSDYNTLLSVWQGNNHPLTEIDCNDDSGTYKQSHLSLTVKSGDSYFINISGFRGATGNLLFSANSVNSLTNDKVADAIKITPDADLSYHNMQNTKAATNTDEVVASCDSNKQGNVWYKYTPTKTQRVVFDTIASDYNTILSLWTGTPLQEIACDTGDGGPSSKLIVELTAGNTYHLGIATGKLGGGSLLPQTGLLGFNMTAPPTNDNMANAISIEASIPYINSQNTSGATLETGEQSPSCSTNSDASVWYLFTPEENYENVTFSTAGSSYDTVLSLWKGGNHPLEEVACNDETVLMTEFVTSMGGVSQLTVPVTESLYIAINGASGASGNLNLQVKKGQIDFAITGQSATNDCKITVLRADIGAIIEKTLISQPVNYQWYQGNTGDDSNLVMEIEDESVASIESVTIANYWVRISNPTGSIDSETITVKADSDCATVITNGLGIDAKGNTIPTTADFAGLATESLQSKLNLTTITQQDNIAVRFNITVDSKHVNKIVDILMLAMYKTATITQFYIRNNLEWQLWNGDMASFTAAQTKFKLPKDSFKTIIYSGLLTGLPGDFAVYVGYRFENGEIFYGSESVDFAVK